MRVVNPDSVLKPVGPYSNGLVVEGKLLFISGQVGMTRDLKLAGDDVTSQARETFENIRKIVEAAGGSMANLVSLTVYLRDIADYKAVNEVRKEYLKEPYPTSTAIANSIFVFPTLKVEISAIAAL